MAVSFSVVFIFFMVLVLIYLFIKNQGMQREHKQLRHGLKTVDQKNRYLLNSYAQLAGQLQKAFISRINSARKHNLINDSQQQMSLLIFNSMQNVLVRCHEHGETVEEALKKTLEGGSVTVDDLNEFISRHSNEVKLPWSKNQPQGFVAACHNLSIDSAPKTESEADKSTDAKVAEAKAS